MKRIYEPQDIKELPETSGVEPHVEITDGIRMHFHADGVSFGMIVPNDSRFSTVLSFEKVREIMVKRARKKGAKSK